MSNNTNTSNNNTLTKSQIAGAVAQGLTRSTSFTLSMLSHIVRAVETAVIVKTGAYVADGISNNVIDGSIKENLNNYRKGFKESEELLGSIDSVLYQKSATLDFSVDVGTL